MLAPSFSSFSVARDRTAAIRTRQFPWGLPDDQLLDTDRTKIQQGNQCFKAAIRIISWLDIHHIPWILENPATSKCWYLPPLQKLESSPHVVAVFTDFVSMDVVGANAPNFCAAIWTLRTYIACSVFALVRSFVLRHTSHILGSLVQITKAYHGHTLHSHIQQDSVGIWLLH